MSCIEDGLHRQTERERQTETPAVPRTFCTRDVSRRGGKPGRCEESSEDQDGHLAYQLDTSASTYSTDTDECHEQAQNQGANAVIHCPRTLVGPT